MVLGTTVLLIIILPVGNANPQVRKDDMSRVLSPADGDVANDYGRF